MTPSRSAGVLTGPSPPLLHRDHPRIDHHVVERLEALGLDQRIDRLFPMIGCHEVHEALIGAAEVRQVDQVDHRGKGREVGERVLRCLDRAALHLLRQGPAGAELAAGRHLDVDLAVGGVLDVFLEIELHDRVAAVRGQHIGGRECHGVIGSLFALRLFLGGLRRGLRRPKRAGSTCDDGGGKAALARKLQKIPPLEGRDLALHFLVYHAIDPS